MAFSAYTLLRRDRNRNGGGIAFYIKFGITFIIREDLASNTDLELLIVEITHAKQKPLLIVCWYRPPNSPLECFQKFEHITGKIDDLNVDYVVTGDLNCDIAATHKSWQTKKLLDIMESFSCSQLISDPTRVTDKSSTTVDLFFYKRTFKNMFFWCYRNIIV